MLMSGVLLPTLVLLGAQEPVRLAERYAAACDVETYEPPTSAELAQFEAEARRRLEPAESDDWQLFGDPRPRGRGFFAVRGKASNVFLQAPHARGDDLDTDALALDLAERLRPRALALSTVSRRQIDLARAEGTYLQRATRAFLESVASPVVVQIHGFSRAKRRSDAGRAADAILSSGHREVLPRARTLARCLAERLDVDVRLYPEVPELGALRNVQGRITPRGDFLHVELSRDLRRRLTSTPSDLDALSRCLKEATS